MLNLGRLQLDNILDPEQYRDVLSQHPKLKISTGYFNSTILTGELGFRISYDNKIIDDVYLVKIEVPSDFPKALPKVWELCDRIPTSYHINPDKSLCLGTDREIIIGLSQNKTLLEFINQFLIRYLFAYTVFETTKKAPFGERSHGARGISEFYQEYFNVNSHNLANKLLRYASTYNISRKKWCPCGSNRRIWKCHNKKFQLLLMSSTQKDLIHDYELIMHL